MIRQPETRPISQEQLVTEVKAIYAGLALVESKCIDVDKSRNEKAGQTLSNEQWQRLIALHRTLLHEHHDFFLASQHPSASPALRRLTSKYSMPARMWRHGIHSFLELLWSRLPHDTEHMLTFIYLAYSIMALLYETVPAFADTWIECLGGLGRYRMAIEDDDRRDREVWTGVSRHWYTKTSDKAPTTGRLYHHLAILARPNALRQLFYYCKSICVAVPFKSAKESILTLFDPVFNEIPRPALVISQVDLAFIRLVGILFTRRSIEPLVDAVEEWPCNLGAHFARSTRRFQESRYYISIALSCALMGFGLDEPDDRPENPFLVALTGDTKMVDMTSTFREALDHISKSLDVLHCILVFIFHGMHMFHTVDWGGYVEDHNDEPDLDSRRPPSPSLSLSSQWKFLGTLLNTLLLEIPDPDISHFPNADKEELFSPLEEDYAMRRLPAKDY